MDSDEFAIVNFDDFCQEYVTDKHIRMLRQLRWQYPNFKCTMFSIPYKSTRDWRREALYSYADWMEIGIHGTKHLKINEFRIKDPDKLDFIYYHLNGLHINDMLSRTFKAPWWKISKEFFDYMTEKKWIIATNRLNCFYPEIKKYEYRYDKGKEIKRDNYYVNGKRHSWHGHIENNGINGLEECFMDLLSLWPKDMKFLTIGEYVRNGQY